MERNPYRPGAAVRPEFLAGRDETLAEFLRILSQSPEIPANVRVSGLRGVGKSVLLQQMQTDAEASGWLTTLLELEPRHNDDAGLTRTVSALCDQARSRASRAERIRTASRVLRPKSVTLSAGEISLRIDPTLTEATQSVAEALIETVTLATDRGYEGFAVLLDEAQVLADAPKKDQFPLSTLVAAVNATQKQGLPVALVLCGLPTLQTHLQKARTYSERMWATRR